VCAALWHAHLNVQQCKGLFSISNVSFPYQTSLFHITRLFSVCAALWYAQSNVQQCKGLLFIYLRLFSIFIYLRLFSLSNVSFPYHTSLLSNNVKVSYPYIYVSFPYNYIPFTYIHTHSSLGTNLASQCMSAGVCSWQSYVSLIRLFSYI